MYVIAFNNKSVVRVSTEGSSLSLHDCLIVREINLKLEVYEVTTHYAICMALGTTHNLVIGMVVDPTGDKHKVYFNTEMIGKVLNPMLDVVSACTDEEKEKIEKLEKVPLYVRKDKIEFSEIVINNEIEVTGIKGIDMFAPKRGKWGVAGRAGSGKSVVMQELMKNTLNKDNNYVVFAGIGERQREGHEMFEEMKQNKIIDESNSSDSKVVLIFADMNQPATIRAKCFPVALAVANYLRSKGTKRKKNKYFIIC